MKAIVKLLYKPFAIVFGLIAARLSARLFDSLWRRVDDRPPPKPTARDATWTKVVAAAGLQAVSTSVTRAAAQRASAGVFRHLFGIWPGPERVQAEEE